MAPNIDLPVNRIQRTFPFCSGGLYFGSKVGLKKVNFLSESSPVAEILRSGTSRTPTLLSLVRYLCLLAACYSFPFTAFPVTEKSNPISDSPLPSQFQHFHWLAPHADTNQTTVPRSLCIGPSLTDTWPFYLTHFLSPSTRKLYASP